MTARNRNNPLALAVLICLSERPMHPYEVATTLRQRQKHESVRLNYGSLYAVVASLEKRGLIAPQETKRAGRLPERTVYRLTDAGLIEAHDWLTDLHLHPGQGLPELRGRPLLPARPAARRCGRAACASGPSASSSSWPRPMRSRELVEKHGLPRLFWVEAEFRDILRGGRAGLRPPAGPRDRRRDPRGHRLVERRSTHRTARPSRSGARRPSATEADRRSRWRPATETGANGRRDRRRGARTVSGESRR